MKVVVYSTITCPYCLMLKEYLKEKNVPFTEKLVDQDDASREEMQKLSEGFLGVPFTAITKEDGSTLGVIGFDKARLNSILQIA